MKFRILVILSALLVLSSCATVKDIAYFQNKLVDQPEKIDKHAGIVIQPKDQLSIVVSSRNPELVTMFNLPVVSYYAGSEITAGGGQQRLMGYVVDND
jgi:polysaccharide export outer membrane protein